METLEANFGCLLRRNDAHIISHEKFPRDFGNEIVIVQIETLRIRFILDRGEFRVEIALAHPQEDWEPLGYMIAAAETKDPAEEFLLSSTPDIYADRLCSNLDLLLDAYSGANIVATTERLRQLKLKKRSEWVEKYNSAQK